MMAASAVPPEPRAEAADFAEVRKQALEAARGRSSARRIEALERLAGHDSDEAIDLVVRVGFGSKDEAVRAAARAALERHRENESYAASIVDRIGRDLKANRLETAAELAAVLLAASPGDGRRPLEDWLDAQGLDALKNDSGTPGDVLTYGMGYHNQRYSPLQQINTRTVGKLQPVWAYSLNNPQGQESQPIVHQGVMYITTHNTTVALNPLTGKQIWKHEIELPQDVFKMACCGIVNRGAAIYEGKIIRALMDNHIIALDAKTGKELWKTKSPDPTSVENGYAMTGAPLIANGVVVVGVAGAEFSHRGFLEGYDPETGKHLWRTYNIPGKGEKGSETWKGDTNLVGGGSSWVTGTYDPELDLVYWGTGNPSPWNPRTREGDALWTNSIVAIRPKTGERVWAFQTTPADPFDYDGVHTPVRATLTIERSEDPVEAIGRMMTAYKNRPATGGRHMSARWVRRR